MVVVEFTSKNYTVLETAGVATVCVNKNIEIATPFTADLRTMDLTATGIHMNVEHYNWMSMNVRIFMCIPKKIIYM